MKKTLTSFGAIAVLIGVALLTSPVLAESSTTVSTASSTGSSTAKKVVKLEKVAAALQARANKEIDRRIENLTKLQTKIQDMKKLSDTEKSSFTTMVQAQINFLNNLKIKITADTDAVTLKADVQSITKAYRIYALVLPQIEIMSAADKLASTTDSLATLAVKLQSRIVTAQTAGKNVTALQTLLADMDAKIADAKIQSAAAIAGVINLKPDNGDKTLMASNLVALKAARADIKTGIQDLKTANKDGAKIRAGLKVIDKGSTATSTAATTTTATTTP